jgi:hypothetical protein
MAGTVRARTLVFGLKMRIPDVTMSLKQMPRRVDKIGFSLPAAHGRTLIRACYSRDAVGRYACDGSLRVS